MPYEVRTQLYEVRNQTVTWANKATSKEGGMFGQKGDTGCIVREDSPAEQFLF